MEFRVNWALDDSDRGGDAVRFWRKGMGSWKVNSAELQVWCSPAEGSGTQGAFPHPTGVAVAGRGGCAGKESVPIATPPYELCSPRQFA